MPAFEEIYAAHADRYDALVAREDHEGNLLAALRQIVPALAAPVPAIDVVEFGAGTGRLTRLLAPFVRALYAFDASAQMLAVARAHLARSGMAHVQLNVADNAAIPLADACADLVIEGWSFGHQTAWAADWRVTVDAALREMDRLLRPGGTAVLIETMTTGARIPRPPNVALAALYDWWERERGFRRIDVRTDYCFASLDEADALMRFFFGDALADQVRAAGSVIVPECTGIWWR
ncbi:MAG: class I SAM-dependent methyltransferase, partial [Anaerolinea sp.]|nr:class I SAM-dependent methyltransferase [Anaerolinea sp.]